MRALSVILCKPLKLIKVGLQNKILPSPIISIFTSEQSKRWTFSFFFNEDSEPVLVLFKPVDGATVLCVPCIH